MASTTMAIIVLIGGFFLLMAFKVPVTFAMLISTIASTVFIPGTNPTTMVRMMIDGVSNFTMLAIPFFIVMGEIMAAGQISDKIVDLANLAVGRFRGGLAYVNCLDSMFFGGISGSAVADVSSLGSVVIPMMVKQGYDREFTVGLTVTTACQGVLIPPSHNRRCIHRSALLCRIRSWNLSRTRLHAHVSHPRQEVQLPEGREDVQERQSQMDQVQEA